MNTSSSIRARNAPTQKWMPLPRLIWAERFRSKSTFMGSGKIVSSKLYIPADQVMRSEEHTSELQSLMRISYAVFCLKKKKTRCQTKHNQHIAKRKQADHAE